MKYRVITTNPNLKIAHIDFNGDRTVEFNDRIAIVEDKDLADYLARTGYFVEPIQNTEEK